METRDIKELLLLLVDYINSNDIETGMCLCTTYMYKDNKITASERVSLFTFMDNNPPVHIKYFGTNVFWWREGDKEPRLKWLNEQIAKL